MLITAIAAIAMGFTGPTTPLHCPKTLEVLTGPAAVTMEYAGAKFGTCCGGCDKPFLADPKPFLAKAIKEKKTIGTFEYDPVSGVKIDSKKAVASSDYKAIRYFFSKAEEKTAFDAKPATYVTDVKSEAYFCPVMGHETNAKEAGSFADVNGVRYYLCCGDCLAAFKKDPSKYVSAASKAVTAIKAVTVK